MHQKCQTPVVQSAPEVPDPVGAKCTKGARPLWCTLANSGFSIYNRESFKGAWMTSVLKCYEKGARMNTGFEAIIGHEEVVRHLLTAIENDRVSHAYLFTGEKGSGKKIVTLSKQTVVPHTLT